MPSSFFNYSITRPYPYGWFTPVTIVGGISLLSLLSVLNFVQNSYVLNIEYANDPNSTISNGIWFKDWPSYITRTVTPTCEPANLPLNTQFFTNQSGLTWTLTSVFTNDSTALLSPSLTYMNNILEDCKIAEIQMDFDGTQDRDVAVSEVTPWDIQVRAFATCGIWTPAGYTFLNITAMYDPVQNFPVAGSTTFVATDSSGRASMYWAQALLSGLWVATVNRIDEVTFGINPPPVKGVAMLYPIHADADITVPSFFNLAFNFLQKGESYGFGWHGPLNPIDVYIKGKNVTLSPVPQIWTPVDQLAKSMYSAALTDLGQFSAPSQANIVANASTIQSFSTGFIKDSILYYTQLEPASYDARQASGYPTGQLGLSASVIVTKYLCQVPRRKPIGDIFISVLLADLVLLQAAWKLYTFVVNQSLMRNNSKSRHCEGCLNTQIDEAKLNVGSVSSIREVSKGGNLVSARCMEGSQESEHHSSRRGRQRRHIRWLQR